MHAIYLYDLHESALIFCDFMITVLGIIFARLNEVKFLQEIEQRVQDTADGIGKRKETTGQLSSDLEQLPRIGGEFVWFSHKLNTFKFS